MNEIVGTPYILISGVMEATIFIGVILVINIAITYLLTSYFIRRDDKSSYKRVADDITKSVESIRGEFADNLALIKSNLVGNAGRRQYLYEKEYDILKNVSDLVCDIELASIRFRANLTREGDDSDKIFIELQDKIKATTDYIFKVRAFIPADVIHDATNYLNLTKTYHMDVDESKINCIQQSKKHWMETDFIAALESGKSLVESIRMRVNHCKAI